MLQRNVEVRGKYDSRQHVQERSLHGIRLGSTRKGGVQERGICQAVCAGEGCDGQEVESVDKIPVLLTWRL